MASTTTRKYRKVATYEGRKGEVKKVVLLYSGGLDTSVMVKWIQEEYNAEVIALTVDIGQQSEDLDEIKQKALNLGASKAIVIDAKDEFAEEYIAKSIKANGSYQGRYYLATPLGRPLLAKWAVKIAAQEGADCIAHGCTGKGNDQVRIEGTALALNPDIKIIAPVREWSMGRDEEMEYAKQHGIPVKQTKDKPYSYDDNMWGISGEGGEIENPALIPPLEKILQVCKEPEKAKSTPDDIKIEFVKGLPVAVDGKQESLAKIIMDLNKLGASHGVGITNHIEDRVVGLKIRDIFEAPAAEIIITAHRMLEKFVSTRYENEFKVTIDEKWSYLCYGGLWYEPLMNNLDAFIDHMNQKVTGQVTLHLYRGSVEAVAVETPNSVFDEKLATFMKADDFNQNASAGFIEHYSLQMKMAQRRERTVLLSIGKDPNKIALLPTIKHLHELGYKLYATFHTREFLKKHKVETILVHKIFTPELKPNLKDLLSASRFDLIINVPSHKEDKPQEATDGQIIRSEAIRANVNLITNVSVAKDFVEKLVRASIKKQ